MEPMEANFEWGTSTDVILAMTCPDGKVALHAWSERKIVRALMLTLWTENERRQTWTAGNLELEPASCFLLRWLACSVVRDVAATNHGLLGVLVNPCEQIRRQLRNEITRSPFAPIESLTSVIFGLAKDGKVRNLSIAFGHRPRFIPIDAPGVRSRDALEKVLKRCKTNIQGGDCALWRRALPINRVLPRRIWWQSRKLWRTDLLRIRGNNSKTWKFYFTLRGSRWAKSKSAIGWPPLLKQNIPENVLELLRPVPK